MIGKLLGRGVAFGERWREPVPRPSAMPGKLIRRGLEPEPDPYDPREPVERRA